MEVKKELIYRKRKSLDELLDENELWSDIYYDLFLKIKDNAYYLKVDAIDIFNEVIYQCISVLKDNHPEDMFKDKYYNGPLRLGTGLTRRYESNLCLSLTYVVLSLIKNKRDRNVRSFKHCLETKLVDEKDFFPACVEYVKEREDSTEANIRITLKAEIEKLTQENERLRLECSQRKVQEKKLEQIKSTEETLSKLLNSIIQYGEKYPYNQNDKADVIRNLLMDHDVRQHIPQGVITSEMHKRIAGLGRKEQPMNFNAGGMFEVKGNNNVNIGGNGNG